MNLIAKSFLFIFTLFGNSANEIEYDFKIMILSAVYTADGSNIKVDATKMAGVFDSTKPIDLTAGITATYAAGINVGKNLQLFDVDVPASTKTYNVYTATGDAAGLTGYKLSGDYVLDTTGKPIEIDKDDLMAFGMSAADYVEVDGAVYLMQNDQVKGTAGADYSYKGWKTIMTDLFAVYEDNGEGSLKVKDAYKNNNAMIASVATEKALFDKYGAQIAWATTTVNVPADTKEKAEEVKNVTFAFADNDARKYGSISSAGVITPKDNISASDLVDGKATLNVRMTIEDIWGMKMTKTFQVTITKE